MSKLKELTLEPSEYVVNRTNPSKETRAVFEKIRDLELEAYINRTPYAVRAIDLLRNKGGKIVNDHVAFRTIRDGEGRHGKDLLEKIFLAFGYQKEEDIRIDAFFLNCNWYEPPQDTTWPKVFISEQQTNELDSIAQKIVAAVVGDYYKIGPLTKLDLKNPSKLNPKTLFDILETPPWNPTSAQYQEILDIANRDPKYKSAMQYTAWTLVNGHRWNHFTILLNSLGIEAFRQLEDLNHFLKEHKFQLNSWNNNEIQGTKESLLKQSSTIADPITHTFADGVSREVPGSFVEFIERFRDAHQRPFRGFIAANAQGILGSTSTTAKK